MVNHEIVRSGQGYRGLLLGLCIKCGGKPKVQRSKITGTFIAKCSNCGNKTLDYTGMDSCILAWNSKNKLSLTEELRRIKEGR